MPTRNVFRRQQPGLQAENPLAQILALLQPGGGQEDADLNLQKMLQASAQMRPQPQQQPIPPHPDRELRAGRMGNVPSFQQPLPERQPPPQPGPLDRLKQLQSGAVDVYMAKRPLLSAERLERDFTPENLKAEDPVGFFKNRGQGIEQAVGRPAEGPSFLDEAMKIISGMDPSTPQVISPQEQRMKALPFAYTEEERAGGPLGKPASESGGGAGSLLQRLDAERGFSVPKSGGATGYGQPPSGQDPMGMITGAAQEAFQRGINTPEKADEYLRFEFKEDPAIEDALREAKQRYALAQERSGQAPGILEYLGYALATLAGANPFQAAEVISRRGEKREDEQRALEQLLGVQGLQIRDRARRQELGARQGMQAEELMNLLGRDQMKTEGRQKERAEDQAYRGNTSARGDARMRLNMLMQAQQFEPNPQKKQAMQAEINQLKKRVQFFGRQLGEPEVDEDGNPIGVSPDVSRLLGLG